MIINISKRAIRLDKLRLKNIAKKLSFEEADNIVAVYGSFLEHSGGFRFLFGNYMPESLLPYPIAILQGALNRMEEHYFSLGMFDRVKLLKETESFLLECINDKDAIKETLVQFGNKKWQKIFIPNLKNLQENQAQAGYLVDRQLWSLTKNRIEELLK